MSGIKNQEAIFKFDRSDSLIKYVQESKIVQAAITEAVHRFYYDRINSDNFIKTQEFYQTNVSSIYNTLSHLMPDWRNIIDKCAKRYRPAIVNQCDVQVKPKEIKGLKINVEYL